MRKAAVFLCAVLTILSVLALCSCSGEKPDGAMTAVKDDSGKITGYERRYHNDNGDITRWDIYDADEVYQSYVLYEYDNRNRLIKETAYLANGIGDHGTTYDYDDDDNLVQKLEFSAKNGAARTLYDKEGNATDIYEYDVTDTLTVHKVYENGEWKSVPIEEETSAETK